jgi:membrane protease YdiL (CAAX protease family)
VSPTSTSDDAVVSLRHRLLRRWRGSPFRGALFDLLLYLGATLVLTVVFAAPLVVKYQRDQTYGPQRVQLAFQPCEAERWNEAAVKDVLGRQGELRPSRASNGRAVPKFMNVWMLPPDADADTDASDGITAAHEPAVFGFFELHPHTGQRPHIDGEALVQAAGCPLSEIRVTPLVDLGESMRALPERLAGPLTVLALCASGLAALLVWWWRGRRLPALPARMPLGRALAWAVVVGLALQAAATGLMLGLRDAGLALEPSNLVPLNALLREQPLVAFLMIAGVAPLGEELFFRHVLVRRFATVGRPLAGVLFSALVFGAMHELTPANGGTLAHLAMTGIYVAIGLALGALYVRTGRFAAVALAHVVGNALALVLLAYSPS